MRVTSDMTGDYNQADLDLRPPANPHRLASPEQWMPMANPHRTHRPVQFPNGLNPVQESLNRGSL